MKFRQKILLPVIPHPFCYVEVEAGKVRFQRWGRERFNLALDDTTASFEPKGNIFGYPIVGHLLGYGDVTISDIAQTQKPVEGLVNGAGLVSYINAVKAARAAKEEKRGVVPPGTLFSRNILVMPRLSRVFDRALWVQHTSPNHHPFWYVNYGEWINRGDRLCSFPIRSSLFREKPTPILSPVSGLVLNRGNPFDHPWAAILLPEYEPPPMTAREVFGQLCDYCYKHRAYIYQKPNEFRGKDWTQDHKLQAEFDKQVSVQWIEEDISGKYPGSGTSSFYEAIEELRAKSPDLRPFLKNLAPLPELSATGEGHAAGPAQEENVPYASDVEAARLSWSLPVSFTEAQVEAVYRRQRDRVSAQGMERFRKDYELLLAAARGGPGG